MRPWTERKMELYLTYRAALASFVITLLGGVLGLGISQEVIISILSVVGAGLTAILVQVLRNKGEALQAKREIAWLEKNEATLRRMNDGLCEEITRLHKENSRLRAQIPQEVAKSEEITAG